MSPAFSEIISKRILTLDGAMGTMIQRLVPDRESYRGDNELLNLSAPDVIMDIHRRYIEAGADIIETNSFGANPLTQLAHGLADKAAQMALEAARIARRAADESPRKVWVAGSVGPGGYSLSMGGDADNPAARRFSFNEIKDSYKIQIDGLLKGGVDLILLETWFDALNAKAAIKAFEELGVPVPMMISATVSDRSGRMLTGQTLEAFAISVSHAPGLVALGINCALGAEQMLPLVREIDRFSPLPLLFFPNAGMPDEMGRYNDSPEEMAACIGRMADEGLLNIVGGCCGTTPEHIRAIADAVRGKKARTAGKEQFSSTSRPHLCVSGLEAVRIDSSRNFTNIGERSNVAGSRKFARLIASGAYNEALEVAAAQIEGGASIIDVNMDDAMLDSREQMQTFLRYVSSDPAVAKAAIMIDSSDWDTVCAGLENVQGKAIVNSISLKEGEEVFVRKALHIKSMGAAMVVMAFDEKGQATSYERKIEISRRSYELLTAAGIDPGDIIFDVNVLSIGTGIAEHARFGVDFIEAVRWIKQNLPGALCSGGISNLSFAFRGNNAVREAMHSAFLYHAIKAGLDMAIVNPQMLQIYDSIDPGLLQAVEDVLFDSDAEATSRLVEYAGRLAAQAAGEGVGSGSGGAKENSTLTTAESPVQDCSARLRDALVKGSATGLEHDVLKSLSELGSAVAVIEGPLMQGMEKVGELFGEGRMFLPQVVKSAKVMRQAVDVLQPYMKAENSGGSKAKVVIATVQGDVHDIGKNITAIVLQCSGFEVIDLGVMVPAEEILAKALECGAQIIGLSGLITPSLYRMEQFCSLMAEQGLDIAVFVGGAAASASFTAVKLAPIYSNVHYGADASATAVKCKKYLSAREQFLKEEGEEHTRLQELFRKRGEKSTIEKKKFTEQFDYNKLQDIESQTTGIDELKQHFDWRLFRAVCGMGNAAEDDERVAELRKEAETLMDSGCFTLTLQARFLDCRRTVEQGCDLIISRDGSLKLPMLRQKGGNCLADLLPVDGWRQMGVFAAKVEGGEAPHHQGCRCGACAVPDLVRHAVSVCLAEAASCRAGKLFTEQSGCKVIMPGIGYSCCPDHSVKRDLLGLLDTGIGLSASCAMIPDASVCTLVIIHPEGYFPDIREVDNVVFDSYCKLRAFSEQDSELFLGQIKVL